MNEIEKILNELRPEFDFTASENFIEDGLLDSFDIIELVAELDQTFSISIDGLDIIPDNFRSIQALTSLIRKNGGTI